MRPGLFMGISLERRHILLFIRYYFQGLYLIYMIVLFLTLSVNWQLVLEATGDRPIKVGPDT